MARVMVCGLDSTGVQVLRLLHQQGASVVGVNGTAVRQGGLSELGISVVVGDLRDRQVWLEAGILAMDVLVLCGNNDTLNLAIVVQARTLNPGIRIINRLFNHSLGEQLDRTLPDHTSMSVAALVAPIFVFAALGNHAIGQLHLAGTAWPMYEERLDRHHPWAGVSLRSLWANPDRMLLHLRSQVGPINLVTALEADWVLTPGDRLVVATRPQGQASRRRRRWRDFGVGLLGNLRRIGQAGRSKTGRSTLVVLLVLLLTIAIASVTYLISNPTVSLADALYFAVGMITGAGGNEFVVERSGGAVKFFTVGMMLVGAAVIGVFYALLNDLILGAHLRQLWEVGQIPIRNHYVVCALGGLGMQIARQLRACGCEVVVIEQNPANRLLNAARGLGIPVIQADATLASSLKAANVQTAAGLFAVTSNDVANIQIALTSKALAPHLSLVVRSTDPAFAQMAQPVFDLTDIFSPADLAAPSFAAAALGGRILGNGLIDEVLWVAVATLITAEHPFCDRLVWEAAREAEFVPLYLERGVSTVRGDALLHYLLKPTNMLYLVTPAHRLEQLWRVTQHVQVPPHAIAPTPSAAMNAS